MLQRVCLEEGQERRSEQETKTAFSGIDRNVWHADSGAVGGRGEGEHKLPPPTSENPRGKGGAKLAHALLKTRRNQGGWYKNRTFLLA